MVIGILTAPRELPTLDASLQSLRRQYKGKVYIFAEPGRMFVNSHDLEIIQHKEHKGAFKNFDFALKYMLGLQTKQIAIFQDDFIYTDKFKRLKIEDEGFGYYNVFTNKFSGIKPPEEGWNRMEIGWKAWGAGYIFDSETLPEIILHDVYQKTMEERNQQIDAAVSEACLQLGLPMWYHNPSLVYTMGVFSTLGHKGNLDGYGL